MSPNQHWINAAHVGSIQKALDLLPEHGGTVYIPTGTYEITHTLKKHLTEEQHLFLVGDGRSSILLNTAANDGPLMHITGAADWRSDLTITIRDLNFIGTPDSGDALVVDYPNNTLVDACLFAHHGGHAIRFGPFGTNAVLRDCWMRDCLYGLRAENIHHLTMHGNQTRKGNFEDAQKQGYHVFLSWDCREVRIVNNHLAYGDAEAIILDGTAQHVISDNTIEGFPLAIDARGTGETVPRDRCRDIVIANNYLHADTGVRLEGDCRGFVIQGNTFINNQEAAVLIRNAEGSGQHSISGNVIRKSVYNMKSFVGGPSDRQGGIVLGDAQGCVVTGNLLDHINPGPGISAGPGGGSHLIATNLVSRSPGVDISVGATSGCLVDNNLP